MPHRDADNFGRRSLDGSPRGEISITYVVLRSFVIISAIPKSDGSRDVISAQVHLYPVGWVLSLFTVKASSVEIGVQKLYWMSVILIWLTVLGFLSIR
jgi:hypothetical protein